MSSELWSLVVGACLLATVGLTVAWLAGWLGRSSVLNLEDAERDLLIIGEHVVSDPVGQSPAADAMDPSLSRIEHQLGAAEAVAPLSASDSPNQSKIDPAILDAVIPGALAFANGTIDWLTPDHAAMVALEQATHKEITNAFDLHSALSEQHYHLLTEGSMTNWSGHVAEAQIADQIDSWAGEGSAVLAEDSNFPGADISFFGGDYQVKFYSDFNDIENVYGDMLIVNQDAANIPSDALHVDFSEPFDPSILDGHDVIVAEGLTLAGSDDAWESAAGLWAGGLDAGDSLDAAGDALVPGIGSAIRVGLSGYKRRAALVDPDLRARASGRVARDAAYGLGGAGGGALIGGLLGGLVDVATLGMTGGLGYVLGGMAGAAYGGKKAGDLSRSSDKQLVDARRERVMDSLTTYGQAVDGAQAQAQEEWSQALAGADDRSSELAAVRAFQCREIEELALAELASVRTISCAEAEELLKPAHDRVQSAARRERSPKARRHQKAWTKRRADIRSTIDSGGNPDVQSVLTLVIASPGGAARATDWLRDRVARRATVFAAAETLLTALHRQSLVDRLSLVTDLATQREDIQRNATATLDRPVRAVEEHLKALRDELVIAGYLSREEAERLGRA